jgi:hypothetical protein
MLERMRVVRGRRRIVACALAGTAAGVVFMAAAEAPAVDDAGPGATRVNERPGAFVPVPDTIPHAEGAYIDRRLIPNLRWITANFDVYVLEGFAGKLRDGTKVGCPKCHVEFSEHKVGLAVDLAPLSYFGVFPGFDFDEPCDRRWRDTTRLAHWAEPKPGMPLAPFRWVGYDGNDNHGCGHHLHLSWVHHAKFVKYKPSRWVQVFRTPRAVMPAG